MNAYVAVLAGVVMAAPLGQEAWSAARRVRADRRLPAGAMVLGVVYDGRAKAYPLARLERTGGLLQETLGRKPIVIFSSPAPKRAAAFEVVGSPDDPKPAFEVRDAGAERVFFVTKPYTAWNVDGRLLTGHPEGIRPAVRLRPVSSTRCTWAVWHAAHPRTEVSR